MTSSISKSTSKFHYGFVIVACCCLIMLVNVGLSMSCAGIFYEPISKELGVSIGRFGLYMSCSYIFSALMLIVAGQMIERYSARWLLAASSAVMGLTFLAMSMMHSVWPFYVAGCIMGATLSFLLYLSFPTLINRWFKARVGLFMGICSAASGIGGMAFNPLCAKLIFDFGWRSVYMIFACVILLVVSPLLAIFLRDHPSDKNLKPYGDGETVAAKSDAIEGVEYTRALHTPHFYLLLLFAFIMMAVSTLNLFIPKYVTSLSFNIKQAGIVVSSVMVGVTIGKVVLGWINDRNVLAGLMTTIVGGIAGIVVLIIGGSSLLILTAGGFLFGWEYAGVTVQTPMIVRSVFGNCDYSKIYSNISIAFTVGGALMSGGWGLLVDATSFRFIFTMGIIALAVGGAAALYSLKNKIS